jgi:hypothetical protein
MQKRNFKRECNKKNCTFVRLERVAVFIAVLDTSLKGYAEVGRKKIPISLRRVAKYETKCNNKHYSSIGFCTYGV